MRIQVPGGFIGQQDLGIHHDCAADGHPLALAAGELIGAVIEAFAEPHGLQYLPGALRRDTMDTPARTMGSSTFSTAFRRGIR